MAAQAQSTGSSASGGGSRYGLGGGQGYMGLNVGRSNYRVPCDGVFGCDRKDNAYSVYVGSLTNSFYGGTWGAELGYINMGEVGRLGGETEAHGINFSLVARYPIVNQFNVVGKVGTTYGRTETSVGAGSPAPGGKEKGFGLSYGIGLAYDVTQNLTAVLAWDSHNFKFEGIGREPVRATTVGLQYRY